MKRKFRPYWTLATRIDGKFYPQFGDYDPKVVKQEWRDSYRADYPGACRIFSTATASQKLINAKLATLV